MERMEVRPAVSGEENVYRSAAQGERHADYVIDAQWEESSASWIDVDQFSKIATITPQAARKALRNAETGLSWRNHFLKVQQVHRTGGAAGKSWRVLVESLPRDLRDKFESQRPDTFRVAKNQSQRIAQRLTAIEQVMMVEPLTQEWRLQIEVAAATAGVTPETIKEWLDRLEVAEGDINALGWKQPSNAGQRRVHVSRIFDKAFLAVGYSDAELAELGDHADNLSRAAWASPVQRAGWRSVQREVKTSLQRHCANIYPLVISTNIHVSKRRIWEHREFRIVDVRAHNRKAFNDGAPCIARDYRQLKPMDFVVMDCKHCDTVFELSDGRRVWSKEISFVDLATMRKFCYFVFPGKGKKVRQEHVVLAFLAMVRDPLWGFPHVIYRDNGSEFKILDLLRECLLQLGDNGPRCIINALPYAAQSKPIEGAFAAHDQQIVSQMTGWAGGNRHKAMSSAVGKPTPPYEGSFEDYVQEYQNRLKDQEAKPFASGNFKGKSPRQLMAEHVQMGWRAVQVGECALHSAFAKDVVFTIRQGKIRYKELVLVHPDLPRGGKITGAISFDPNALPTVRLPDGRWLLLEEEHRYHPLDVAGARESSARKQRDNRNVSELKKSAGEIDLAGNLAYRLAVMEEEVPLQPKPPIIRLLTDETEARALAVAEGKKRKKKKSPLPDLLRAGRLAETLALEARHG
jgi:hypothetical protein